MTALNELVTSARAAHARLCLDTVTVSRVTSKGTLNTATSTYSGPTTSAVYSGAARLKRVMAKDVQSGDVEREVARLVLVLPYAATGSGNLRNGDLVTFTVSADAALVGKVLTIVGPEHGSTSSARRYTIEEVSA